MRGSIIQVLIVDDYEPWRRFIRLALLAYDKLQIAGEASDGFEAIEKARQLQPDLILLDIGLPKLNGIEAARRIREVSPTSKIIFVTGDRAWDLAQEGLRVGARGYVVKSGAARELLAAIWAVLDGQQFLSSSLARPSLNGGETRNPAGIFPWQQTVRAPAESGMARHHEVGFYSDDRSLLDAVTQFIGAALKIGNAAIVLATESHRSHLLVSLQRYGLNVVTAVEQGRYTAVDAAGALSTVMVDGKFDAVGALAMFEDLIERAAEAASGGQNRVAIFGEGVQLLWAEAQTEAAIEMEKLGDQLTQRHDDVDILCGYFLPSFQNGTDRHRFEKVCAAHSAVHMW